MLESVNNVVNHISGFLYEPYIVPFLLIFAGVFFTLRTKCIQIRCFTEMFKVINEKPKTANGMSSFGALMVSTASRVGTGSIVGVSTAICLGGPGAIFWMWLTAWLGGATAFTESVLAQIYKKRNEDGSCYGGPSYYMQDALGQRWLGVVFSIIIIITYAVGYNMLAAYNLQSAFMIFPFYSVSTPAVIGIILAVLFGSVVFGGAKRLIKVAATLVPFIGSVYILVALIVIIMNIANIGVMFRSILVNAFDLDAILGGFTGSCLFIGLKRGLYSNEAGMGSAPNAAASADVSHPVKQGLVQVLSVFIDTLLICSATAIMCLITGIEWSESKQGAAYVQECLEFQFGAFGPIFVASALALFAYTTLVGNYYYCECCLKFIMKKEPPKGFIIFFRIIATVLVCLGTFLSAGLAWDTADMLQAFMVIINIPTILILSKPSLSCFKDYMAKKKAGEPLEYVANPEDIRVETEYWR